MSNKAEVPQTDCPDPQASEAGQQGGSSDPSANLEDVPIESIDASVPDAVVAFRLGRAVSRFKSIVLPLAVTNLSYYRNTSEDLHLFLDAAVGRLCSPSGALSPLKELSECFEAWYADLDSEFRHEELAEMFQHLPFVGTYDFQNQVIARIGFLDLDLSRQIRSSIPQIVENSLATEYQRNCYAAGLMAEQGILPKYTSAETIRYRDSSETSPLPKSAEIGNHLGNESPTTRLEIETVPIHPGEFHPDSNWPELMRNRLQALNISVSGDLLNRIGMRNWEYPSNLSLAVISAEDSPLSAGLPEVNESKSPRRSATDRNRGKIDLAASKAIRLHCFQQLVSVIEGALTAHPANLSQAAMVPPTEDVTVNFGNCFQKVGTDWQITFECEIPLVFRDINGFFYLHYLITHHGQKFTGTMLRNALVRHNSPVLTDSDQNEVDGEQNDLSSSDQILDAQALCSYGKRLQDIDEELKEDINRYSSDASESLHLEKEQILKELSKATGIRNRKKQMSNSAKNDRDTVIKAIQVAIKQIGTKSESLAEHFENSVSTADGSFCYQASTHILWTR